MENGLHTLQLQNSEPPTRSVPALSAPEPPAKEPVSSPPIVRRRAGKRTVALAATLVVLIAALVTVLVVTRPGKQPAAQASATSAVQVEVAAPEPPPVGYAWHVRPGQFRVALPRVWTAATAGPFSATGPQGTPRLSVAVQPLPANTVAMLTAAEATVGLPDYHRIRIVEQSAGETVWEFTYQQGRDTMRAMQVVIPDPATKKIFILDWRDPRTDWARDLTTFDQIVSTFSSLLGE